MNRAFANLNKRSPDLEGAKRYADSALALALPGITSEILPCEDTEGEGCVQYFFSSPLFGTKGLKRIYRRGSACWKIAGQQRHRDQNRRN